MRLKLIACKAVSREFSYLCAVSPNIVDISFLRQGNHNSPDLLRKVLQDEIDLIESGNDYHTNNTNGPGVYSPYTKGGFDAILIGYGLCANGIAGLSSRKYKLVAPRAHDCITFLLGSKEKYGDYFKNLPGTYWYTMSWIECGATPTDKSYLEAEAEYYRSKGYDGEEIEYLQEASREWIKNYNTAAYIKMPFYDKEEYQDYTKKSAESCGWDYRLIDGDMKLMRDFINGKWDDERFLTVLPGHKIIPSHDDKIIGVEKIC